MRGPVQATFTISYQEAVELVDDEAVEALIREKAEKALAEALAKLEEEWLWAGALPWELRLVADQFGTTIRSWLPGDRMAYAFLVTAAVA